MQYAVAGSRLVLSEAEALQVLGLVGKPAFFAFGVEGWSEQLRTIHPFDFTQGTLPTNGGAGHTLRAKGQVAHAFFQVPICHVEWRRDIRIAIGL